ncbi:MAG: right-handed parallel beta-helix repeat-containing protein [Coriobacteriales bacterium]|jgi:hypothetical protein|nr:right-handed parallel beta-helix repeat-containing protein [Coriobacteriales bacterium]
MQKTKKRVLSTLLAVVLSTTMLVALPTKAYAAVPTIVEAEQYYASPSSRALSVTFSEGIWGNAGNTTPVSAASFNLTFSQNGGTATNVVLSDVRAALGTVPTGGEINLTFVLTVTGQANGLETFEIRPASATSVYSSTDAMAVTETTGVINVIVPPASTEWQTAAAGNGVNSTVTTTRIDLTFDNDPLLRAAQITVTGASVDSLIPNSPTVYWLFISDITVGNAGSIIVKITPDPGATISIDQRLVQVWVAGPFVCSIEGVLFNTLDDALATVNNGQTITLLEDIEYDGTLYFDNGKDFTIDLDGYALDIDAGGAGLNVSDDTKATIVGGTLTAVSTDGYGVRVYGSTLALGDGGVINATGASGGVYAEDGAQVTVTNATGGGYGVNATDAGTEVTVVENILDGSYAGIYVEDGAVVVVYGNVNVTGEVGIGVFADGEDSEIYVEGNVNSSFVGAYAFDQGIVGILGNITTQGMQSVGASAAGGGTVLVDGNITVSGLDSIGVYSSDLESAVGVGGNIVASGLDAIGVSVENYGIVVVDGTITAPIYIYLAGEIATAADYVKDYTDIEALEFDGYRLYLADDLMGFVWVAYVQPGNGGGSGGTTTPGTGDIAGMLGLLMALAALTAGGASFALRKRQTAF